MMRPSPRVGVFRRLGILYAPVLAVGMVLVLMNIGQVNGGLIVGIIITSIVTAILADDLERNA